MVSAYANDDKGYNSGSAYVFILIEGTWVEVEKLLPANGKVGDEFGRTVALRNNHVVIGCSRKDNYRGAAYFHYINQSLLSRQYSLANSNSMPVICSRIMYWMLSFISVFYSLTVIS